MQNIRKLNGKVKGLRPIKYDNLCIRLTELLIVIQLKYGDPSPVPLALLGSSLTGVGETKLGVQETLCLLQSLLTCLLS